jgi:hypothetical protein
VIILDSTFEAYDLGINVGKSAFLLLKGPKKPIGSKVKGYLIVAGYKYLGVDITKGSQ